jgi:hypothetical protein
MKSLKDDRIVSPDEDTKRYSRKCISVNQSITLQYVMIPALHNTLQYRCFLYGRFPSIMSPYLLTTSQLLTKSDISNHSIIPATFQYDVLITTFN